LGWPGPTIDGFVPRSDSGFEAVKMEVALCAGRLAKPAHGRRFVFVYL
jgi:hypothetical protein